MQLAETANPEQELHHDAAIVRHERRPQWGAAIMLWERNGKRGYRFEDGADRVFMTEYCNLFAPCSTGDDVAAALMAARVETAAADETTSTKRKKVDTPTLIEQAKFFRQLFAEGFTDSTYVKKHRGGSGRRIKRHRVPAIADAQTRLAKEVLDQLIAAGNYGEIFTRAHDVLAKTDLVTTKQLQPLRTARPSAALAEAFRDYLYAPDPDGAVFDEFLRRLGRNSTGRYTWPLMTALRALVNPNDDICVRPTVFQVQARRLEPQLAKRMRPTGETYNRWRAFAEDLRARLAGVGLEVTDLWDVYDLVWLTLRPAALREYPKLRAAEHVEDTDEAAANDDATDEPANDTPASNESPTGDETEVA